MTDDPVILWRRVWTLIELGYTYEDAEWIVFGKREEPEHV